MFSIRNLLHKKEKNKEEEKEQLSDHPQLGIHGIYKGTYCPQCGYMEVNMQSSLLPLEGFAQCPNCGALLKNGEFKETEDHQFTLYESTTNHPRKTGGHYRVRKSGPALIRTKGKYQATLH